MKYFLLFALLLVTQMSLTQEAAPYFLNYDWEAAPSYTVDQTSDESIIALKDSRVIEFYFDENNQFIQYSLEHRAYWLNSDDKIEAYNKVYLPYSSNSFLEANRARVITKEGKILELDKSKILTAKDEETQREYKYFAFEGIEKGSIIEYYYVVKKAPSYNGARTIFQSDYPKKNISFDLYAPTNLLFKFKSYNGLPEVELDTTSTEKLHWKFELDKMESLEEEEFSSYEANLQYLVYKLDENLANGVKDISSYSLVSQRIHSYYSPEISKQESKKIEKLMKTATKDAGDDTGNIIRKLEYYIKNNFFITEAGAEELSQLDKVLDNKVANESGIAMLYISCFKYLGIDYEMVITSDRSEVKFDNEFEANNFINDFMFYFPKTKSYISPKELESRYGYPPPNLTDTYGLFIKEVTLGDYTSALGKIKYIEPASADKTFHNMELNVSFDSEDVSIANVNLKQALGGYYAMYFQPFLHLMKEEDKDDLLESLAKQINDGIDITKKEIVNPDPELFGVKPFEANIDFTSDAFMEKAGNKYLFKIGELIGPQSQLYQEKQRKLPVENEFQRSYIRTLNITIPEGYKIANPGDINISNSYSEDGKELISFESTYTLDGNKLTVKANEYYRVNIMDVSKYEEFRTVINSAADFNKITLVLEPVN